jgi:hypothetical protein
MASRPTINEHYTTDQHDEYFKHVNHMVKLYLESKYIPLEYDDQKWIPSFQEMADGLKYRRLINSRIQRAENAYNKSKEEPEFVQEYYEDKDELSDTSEDEDELSDTSEDEDDIATDKPVPKLSEIREDIRPLYKKLIKKLRPGGKNVELYYTNKQDGYNRLVNALLLQFTKNIGIKSYEFVKSKLAVQLLLESGSFCPRIIKQEGGKFDDTGLDQDQLVEKWLQLTQ